MACRLNGSNVQTRQVFRCMISTTRGPVACAKQTTVHAGAINRNAYTSSIRCRVVRGRARRQKRHSCICCSILRRDVRVQPSEHTFYVLPSTKFNVRCGSQKKHYWLIPYVDLKHELWRSFVQNHQKIVAVATNVCSLKQLWLFLRLRPYRHI